jgi:glycosyltransferase involved in cell wall biosynthesis
VCGSAVPELELVETLSVLVPAYNEGRHVKQALERALAVLDSIGLPYEIFLISDGSSDDTVEQARLIKNAGLRVLSYGQRRGKGYALRYGWSFCSGTYVAFLDADLDLDPEGLRSLLTLIRNSRADAAIGSKVHPDSHVVYPRARRLQSRVFRAIVRTWFRLDVSDTQTGLKVFRREVLESVMPVIESDGFTLDLELLVFANDDGFQIIEGPIDLEFGFSSTTNVRAVVDVVGEMRRVARRRRRVRRSGKIGSTGPLDRPQPEMALGELLGLVQNGRSLGLLEQGIVRAQPVNLATGEPPSDPQAAGRARGAH